MILHGNQRAGGTQLAKHLMNDLDNEHITIHELRGFISDDLHGAFNEAYAISRGTRCKQFLFSLSLNPPSYEDVSTDVFEAAIENIEAKLGLTNQPRAIVFHEKQGRRHAHCVWSRIDIEHMRAVNLPHYKLKLRSLSQSLFLEHGWQMPRGLMDSEERDPFNFTHAEYQQALRQKLDPKSIKKLFQECWTVSDSRTAFAQALEERGYFLAIGRRGYVAVDWQGEILSISRNVGLKAKQVREKLGDPANLEKVEEVTARLAKHFTKKLEEYVREEVDRHTSANTALKAKKQALILNQRSERMELDKCQFNRRIVENKTRSSRLPTGIKALWFRVTGKYRCIKSRNEEEARLCDQRDHLERQRLIEKHLSESNRLHMEVRQLRHTHVTTIRKLNRNLSAYSKLPNDIENQKLTELRSHPLRKRRSRSPDLC